LTSLQKNKKGIWLHGKPELSDLNNKLYNGVANKDGYIVVNNMVSKDQGIGWLIFLVCVVVIVGYIVALFFPKEAGSLIGLEIESTADIYYARIWLVAIPVLIAFVAILAIGAWIGWTMATTPPPKPIEEFEVEEKPEEEKED